jgi:putative thioredoxin
MSSPPDRRLPTENPGSLTAEKGWILDVDARSFEREVIERSSSVPVLIDFWASWCGPCKTLTPLLEKRAREGKGRFVLAKIDIDRNPELAQAFRVQAVPTVLAIVQGRLQDGFQGALGEAELDEFLERIAPGRAPRGRGDVLVERAGSLIGEGKREQAIGLLRELLRDSPEHVAGRFLLAEALIDAGKPQDARLVLEKVPAEEAASERGKALRARLDFAEHAGDVAKLEQEVRSKPDDLATRIQLGKAQVAARDYARGLENLLEVVRRDPLGAGKEAKAAMLEVFGILGLQDPLANDYRFKLSLELFS